MSDGTLSWLNNACVCVCVAERHLNLFCFYSEAPHSDEPGIIRGPMKSHVDCSRIEQTIFIREEMYVSASVSDWFDIRFCTSRLCCIMSEKSVLIRIQSDLWVGDRIIKGQRCKLLVHKFNSDLLATSRSSSCFSTPLLLDPQQIVSVAVA